MSKKSTGKGVAPAVKQAVTVGTIAFEHDAARPDAIDIIADQSSEELQSLGGSLRVQRTILTERRAQVQRIVNELDSQINVLDHALRLIEAN